MKTIDVDRLAEIAGELEKIAEDMRSNPGHHAKQDNWQRRLGNLSSRMYNLMKYGPMPPRGNPD